MTADRRAMVRKAMATDLSEHPELFDDNRPTPDLPDVDVGAEPMVGRGLRLPLHTDAEVRAIAARRGVKPSTLIRQWIELGIATEHNDQVVSVADMQRALGELARRAA